MKTHIFTLLLLSLFIAGSISAQNIGEKAPDFTVTTLDGDEFKLADQQGKLVVLYFFGNSCPYCVGSAPSIEEKIHKKYMDNDKFAIIGIDTWDGSSSNSTVNGFKNSTGVTFDLVNQGGSIASDYNSTYDRLLVIDDEGILQHKGNTAVSSDLNSAIEAIEQHIPMKDGQTTSIFSGENNVQFKVKNLNSTLTITTNGQITSSPVSIELVGINGQRIKKLMYNAPANGSAEYRINVNAIPQGIYILSIKASTAETIQKIYIQ